MRRMRECGNGGEVLNGFLLFHRIQDLTGERAKIVKMSCADAKDNIPIDGSIGMNSGISETYRLPHHRSRVFIDTL